MQDWEHLLDCGYQAFSPESWGGQISGAGLSHCYSKKTQSSQSSTQECELWTPEPAQVRFPTFRQPDPTLALVIIIFVDEVIKRTINPNLEQNPL